MEHIIQQMERERGLDRAAAIADMRFGFIKIWWIKPCETPRNKEQARSNAIDRILTGKYTAIPLLWASWRWSLPDL